jgi:glyoxylate reductase
MLGHRIGGKRLGIVGMGRIGQAVARRARPSACRSTITTAARWRRRSPKSWARPIGKASTRCWRGWTSSRSTVRTRRRPIHLLSARRLKLIRKEAYIVNTARGEVIDEDTMIKLIESGEIGGAGLDVYEHEPAVNPKLVRLAGPAR